ITYFRKMSGKTVEIVGKVTDLELKTYYRKCTALIFPGVEDFGLVMVEAQSFGKPVIAFKAGGATEIIKEGTTGVFFEKANVTSLVNTLKLFDKKRYNGKDCIRNAERFSVETFKKGIMNILQRKEFLA
ncbi:MAG: glycosyltransferase, partial [Candidatus Levyibacteriota bacterium]